MTVPEKEIGVPDATSEPSDSKVFTRETLAYVGFVVAILSVYIGAGLYNVGAGLIAGGLLLAIFSYLLGNE